MPTDVETFLTGPAATVARSAPVTSGQVQSDAPAPAIGLPPRRQSAVRSTAAADWLARLNDAQRRAVTFTGGDLVGAPAMTSRGGDANRPGAGTGKTATLAHRVAWLVVNGADPGRVLLLTFRGGAAQEMTGGAERLDAVARRVAGRGRRR